LVLAVPLVLFRHRLLQPADQIPYLETSRRLVAVVEAIHIPVLPEQAAVLAAAP
jgi:hypothetical protein